MSIFSRFVERHPFYFIALCALILFVVGGVIDCVGCGSRWRYLHPTRFGVLEGCMVETSPGRWVPEESLRVTE